jgi:two-component system LytT family response regulator
MIRTLIVDDEPIARAGVRGMLADDAEIAVVAECANGGEALEFLRAYAVDLLLLDVQMPVLDGLEVLAALERQPPAGGPPVTVLLTAHDAYALQAFEAQALDYVVKPFTDRRFGAAIARAKRAVLERRLSAAAADLVGAAGVAASASASLPGEPYLTRILVPTVNGSRLVPVDEVDWIEAADYCARIRAGDRAFVIRETMDRLERRLDPRRFVRCHRSIIVNLDRVHEIQAGFHGRHVLILKGGVKLPLSRGRRPAVERLLGQTL